MHHVSKISAIVGLTISFTGGILASHLAAKRMAPRVAEPIQTDFCFLAKNTPLFVGRRFATSANVEFGIDSEFLNSPKCPNNFVYFRLTAVARAELSKLPHHGSIGNMTVPTIFEGTIVPRSPLMRWRESFSPGSDVELITIEHITSSEVDQ